MWRSRSSKPSDSRPGGPEGQACLAEAETAARVKAAGVPGVTTCASVPIRDGKAWNHAAWWKAVCGEVHARGAFCPVASEKQPYDSIDALHAGDRC